jgi:hypothetical protein
MRDFDIFNRRYFCYSIAGLTVNIGLGKLALGVDQRPKMPAANREFVIVNGWVLTGEDVAASELAPNVV